MLGYLGPSVTHLPEAVVHHFHEGLEFFVFVVKAISKDNGADDVGDGPAQEKRGVKGLPWSAREDRKETHWPEGFCSAWKGIAPSSAFYTSGNDGSCSPTHLDPTLENQKRDE